MQFFFYCMKIDYKTWDRLVVLLTSITGESRKQWFIVILYIYCHIVESIRFSSVLIFFFAPFFYAVLFYRNWHSLTPSKLYWKCTLLSWKIRKKWCSDIIFFNVLRDISYCLLSMLLFLAAFFFTFIRLIFLYFSDEIYYVAR